ncbi:hypothetical protein DB346_06335 [Verrucomicrobia bacterium LW23]|nr:hypothetical protein DB346_06335 [Verrucomicrobia bacterium LW23]
MPHQVRIVRRADPSQFEGCLRTEPNAFELLMGNVLRKDCQAGVRKSKEAFVKERVQVHGEEEAVEDVEALLACRTLAQGLA